MSAGSIRSTKIDGVPYNVAADANISLNPRTEKEPIPHSGGNMIKRTTMPANAEAVKLILTPTEYDILEGVSDDTDDIPLSYEMTDGSSFKTTGQIMLGPYQTEDSSCELIFMTSTGKWEIFAAS